MPRQLRTRISRPNYATLLQLDEDEAGPSAPVEEDLESESDFAPEEIENDQAELAQSDIEVDDNEMDEDPSAGVVVEPVPSTRKKVSPQKNPPGAGRITKALPVRTRQPSSLAPGLARSNNRHNYSLPQPHVHHRHRAVPLYHREANVERLKNAPSLFTTVEVVLTNSFTKSSQIIMRLGRAWGANIGPGPVWELMEDRGWYKEAVLGINEADERNRRPRVYTDVSHGVGMKILDEQEVSSYLPSHTSLTEEGLSKPPPPLVCSFGPFEDQKRVELNIFETFKLSDKIPGSYSQVLNAGAPVWGIDWCPIHPADRSSLSHKQYLAISTFPSSSFSPYIGLKSPRPFPSCIQIWSLARTGLKDDQGKLKCEMVICIESGPAHDLKWCPLPSNDQLKRSRSGTSRRLGFLAGTFQDGSLSVFAVPYPSDIVRSNSESDFVSIKLDPLLRIELEETCCWSLDWANSELIAIGCTNGCIAVYDVSSALCNGERSKNDKLLPLHYFAVHQSAIRSLTWIRVPSASSSGTLSTSEDPTVIASGGYDGVQAFTDLREQASNVFNRTRDVINTIVYSPFGAGVATIDHENMVKMYSASPSMIGRGHTLLESGGPVWSISCSDYHPIIAVGSADGSCMTSNVLKSTRKGGLALQPLFSYKIYQLDYSPKNEEYRMLEQFLPRETQDRPLGARSHSKNPNVEVNPLGTGTWSREVGVHRVAWNSGNGLANAHLLASSTGSGLCRIDWLKGRWFRDKIPYSDVERIRGEVEGESDIDEDYDSE